MRLWTIIFTSFLSGGIRCNRPRGLQQCQDQICRTPVRIGASTGLGSHITESCINWVSQRNIVLWCFTVEVLWHTGLNDFLLCLFFQHRIKPMNLGSHSWKQVRRMLPMSEKLSWPWLLQSRQGNSRNLLSSTHCQISLIGYTYIVEVNKIYFLFQNGEPTCRKIQATYRPDPRTKCKPTIRLLSS